MLVFDHEPDGTYSSLIVQLEAVIIEVPTVQALRVRAITHGDYTGPNICHQ